jgi:MoaA/NifB/PqqE/SkfB family radical SAM enzyme
MDVSLYRKLLEQMREFALPYSICLGGSGEPLMHPKFYETAEASLAEPLLKNFVIETNGVLADANFRNFYSSMNDRRVRVIVNLSAIDTGTYGVLHGADSFDAVQSNVIALRETIADARGCISSNENQ